jgi:hypothetical protein
VITLPSLTQLDRATSMRIWLCTGPTDMRRGFDRLAEQAQQVTRQDPPSERRLRARSRAPAAATSDTHRLTRAAHPTTTSMPAQGSSSTLAPAICVGPALSNSVI